ncbi:hypothetical protein RO3G_08104 [Rhizopus delemar RA 99-880]|uniref:Tc1-like transposase DDE domain-containing protein n=1 Tax=Rhizopus delemar (strain RA 99-880 / ATCC MYA-4621 / FGSC 9543 / NRRL 43880) TaxID=246409 RepID=I1C4L9_RHIO9|nr:hypothetical protein RO3G_08104 [Rhizopus delemar RA 99-880]|eukprot:EIE83399.1 hypothetical protein RO3G_08104 [Rhizopus delemar RA 99-880]
MDNAPIHHHDAVDPIILQRGYIPVYLPPYSPELNPIEMFWKPVPSLYCQLCYWDGFR